MTLVQHDRRRTLAATEVAQLQSTNRHAFKVWVHRIILRHTPAGVAPISTGAVYPSCLFPTTLVPVSIACIPL